MIDPEERFSLLPYLYAGNLLIYPFIDNDRRQYMNLTIHATSLTLHAVSPDDPDVDRSLWYYWKNSVIRWLPRICDSLDSEVGAFTVDPMDPDGIATLLSSTSDPKQCPAYNFSYPTLSEIGLPIDIKTIKRSELGELERLSPSVDSVSFEDQQTGETHVAIFKYYFSSENIEKTVKDLQILAQLQSHPHIANLTHVVLDDTGTVVVGFLLKSYPEAEPIFNKADCWVKSNIPCSFKLSWVTKLVNLIDGLNLTYGIVGRDFWLNNVHRIREFDELILDSLALFEPITPANALRDIYLTVICVYEAITHQYTVLGVTNLPLADLKKRAMDILTLKDNDWPQPPQVILQGGSVDDFKRELEDWVTKRKWVHFPVQDDRPTEENLPDGSLHADEPDDQPRAGEKRKIQAVEPVGCGWVEETAEDVERGFGGGVSACGGEEDSFESSEEGGRGSNGERTECLLWDPKTWKRDSTLPQPFDNPIVKWVRIPETRKENGKQYLANGQLVTPEEPGGEDYNDGDAKDGKDNGNDEIIRASQEIPTPSRAADRERDVIEEELDAKEVRREEGSESGDDGGDDERSQRRVH